MTKPQRAIRELSFSWVETLDQLLDSKVPAIFRTHAPHPPHRNLPLLPGSDFNIEIQEKHREPADVPHVGLAVIPRALVTGPSIVGTDTDVWQMREIVPGYVNNRLPTGDLGRIAFPRDGNALHISGFSVLLTHFNGVYGHWLLEGMPRLLLLKTLAPILPDFQIVVPEDTPRFIELWINMILPEIRIVKYNPRNEFARCERLLLPTMLCSRNYFYHMQLSRMIDEICLNGSADTHKRNKVYVSRHNPSPFRILTNRLEIERIAAENGFRIVIPEYFPIAEQISVFQNAGVIAGEFGSAMHNTIFSPPGSVVICLNWLNKLQGRIAHLRHQHVGYIFPASGEPTKIAQGQTSQQSYSIDPTRFARFLRQSAG